MAEGRGSLSRPRCAQGARPTSLVLWQRRYESAHAHGVTVGQLHTASHAVLHHRHSVRRRAAADRLLYVGPIGRTRISLPALPFASQPKKSHAEITAFRLEWKW